MTVLNSTNKRIEDGDGFKKAFDFPFKIFSETDIEVYKVVKATKVATLQTLNVNYTVSINSISEGGTVTFVDAPESTEQSLINRDIAMVQPTDIPSSGNVREEQLENEYDRGRMIDQQLQEQIDRCLKLPITETQAPAFPIPSPGKLLGWSDDGLSLVNIPITNESFVAFKTKTASYAMLVGDSIILADASAGALNITLPVSADSLGKIYRIKKIDSSANKVTILGQSPDTIDGAGSLTLNSQNDAITLGSDGTIYRVFA